MFEQPVAKKEEEAEEVSAPSELQSENSAKNETRKLLMEINSYSVPNLKQALTERNIAFNSKTKKADLVALLQDAVKNGNNPEKTKKEEKEEQDEEKGSKKRGRGAKKGKGAEKEEEKEEEKEKKTSKRKSPAERATAQKKAKVKEDESSRDTSAVSANRANQMARVQDRMMEQKLLQYLINQYGSKIGHLLHYLRTVWKQEPNKRFIIFSRSTRILAKLGNILQEFGIDVGSVDGTIAKRTKAINTFKAKESTIRVLLMYYYTSASGANLIESDHIILLDPLFEKMKTEAEAIEKQAIGRAHRQGQFGQVTVTRFIIQNTLEHTTYLQHHAEVAEGEESVSKLQRGFSTLRTNSAETIIANAPTLQKSGSLVDLLGSSSPITVDLQPPTASNDATKEKENENENENNEGKESDKKEEKDKKDEENTNADQSVSMDN